MGLPESLVLLVERVDAINHLLDQLDLAVAQPVLVGDVVGDAGLAAGLAPGASRLEAELLASKEDRNKPVLCTVQVYTLTWP